ncbi:hypothetical protein Barb6XT_02419 [Bacteroidales bacterium Barb6XT]|nr:hypothetical protein Barb6XT_02419 [Bacteroidales bacterium Barb6XT]
MLRTFQRNVRFQPECYISGDSIDKLATNLLVHNSWYVICNTSNFLSCSFCHYFIAYFATRLSPVPNTDAMLVL